MNLTNNFNNNNNNNYSLNDKNYWINKLELVKHIEGGYFKQILESSNHFENKRSYFTSICYLLDSNNKSHFHRIKSDEVWYYHFGLSMVVHCILPNGSYEKIVLGPRDGEYLQYNVKGGTIFCSSPLSNSSINKNNSNINNNNSNKNNNNSNKNNNNLSFKNNKQISTEYINNNQNNNSGCEFSIVGCMVSPGFIYSEFELFTKNELLNIFPQHKELIEQYAYDSLPDNLKNNNNNSNKTTEL